MDPVKNFIEAAEEGDVDVDLTLKHTFRLRGEEYVARDITKGEQQVWLVASGNGVRSAYSETATLVRALLHDSSWDDDDGNLLIDDEDLPDDFDPDAQYHEIEKRWRRARDPLNVDDFVQVIFWLVEVRSGNPTSSSSDSPSGRPKSGTSSTASSPRKASTRSRSRSGASTT